MLDPATSGTPTLDRLDTEQSFISNATNWLSVQTFFGSQPPIHRLREFPKGKITYTCPLTGARNIEHYFDFFFDRSKFPRDGEVDWKYVYELLKTEIYKHIRENGILNYVDKDEALFSRNFEAYEVPRSQIKTFALKSVYSTFPSNKDDSFSDEIVPGIIVNLWYSHRDYEMVKSDDETHLVMLAKIKVGPNICYLTKSCLKDFEEIPLSTVDPNWLDRFLQSFREQTRCEDKIEVYRSAVDRMANRFKISSDIPATSRYRK